MFEEGSLQLMHQIPDERGNVISSRASRGKIVWSVRGRDPLALLGRSEQVDLTKGISSSYACPSYFYGDSWTVNNSSVINVSGIGDSADLSGVDSGSGILTAHWEVYSFTMEHADGIPFCVEQSEMTEPTAPAQVRRPHHLKVGNDLMGSTTTCGGVKRILNWIVHDQPHNPVGSVSVIEVPTGPATDSCANQKIEYTDSCSPVVNAAGLFEDTLRTGCPGSGTCGFDWEPNRWKWCNGTVQVGITTTDYNVHYNEIKVNGTASSLVDVEIFP